MKKIMIAAAIVCAAAFAQASTFNWSISSMTKIMVAGSGSDKTLYNGGPVYLFCAETYSQSALLDAGKAFDTSKAIASSSVASGVLSPNGTVAVDFGGESDWGKTGNFYIALIDGDNIYVSANKGGLYQEKAATALSISAANSNQAVKDWEKGSTFSAAGWYSTVPEPTSGLLLLLGVAGLALRRRRA